MRGKNEVSSPKKKSNQIQNKLFDIFEKRPIYPFKLWNLQLPIWPIFPFLPAIIFPPSQTGTNYYKEQEQKKKNVFFLMIYVSKAFVSVVWL